MHGRARHEVPTFARRLDRQAASTRALRSAVYARARLERASSVLDVGCGTGGVTTDLARWGAQVVGLDVDGDLLARATARLAPAGSPGSGRDAGLGGGDDRTDERPRAGAVALARADGRRLPFRADRFDAAVCNLVLLWTPEPGRVVAEMARVVRPGGVVVASMEPDYGGKVHWPENPMIDLVFQGEGIRKRGGDPHAGRKLRSHFVAAGLQTEVGISTTEVPTTEQDLALFRRNRGYYRRLLEESGFAVTQVDAWEAEYEDALSKGVQTSFLPVFWAIGRKPVPGDIDRP